MPTKGSLKIHELLILSFRSFRTKPQRAFLTIMGMSIGIATVLMLVSLGYGLQYILIGKLITTEDSLVTMEIMYPPESNLTIKPEFLDNIKGYEGVSEISPIAQFPGEISAESSAGLLIETWVVEDSFFRLSGLLPDIGQTFLEEKGIIVSSQALLAQGLNTDELAIGRLFNLKIFFQNPDGILEDVGITNSSPLVGIITDESMPPTAIISTESLGVMTPPFFTKMFVKAESVDVLESLRDKLISDGFLVSARIDLVTQARKITNIITIVLGVFGITALIVSAIGMFNTMLVGFLERTYEVGILKSIGATDYDVRNLFLVEASIMGFLGGICGILIGFILSKIFNIGVSILSQRFGGESIDLFLIPIWFTLLIMVFSTFIGFLSGWVPAHKAARLSPKDAFTRK